MATINKTWFKNKLRSGQFEFKCKGKYSDDYARDNDLRYSRHDWIPAPSDLFQSNDEFYIKASKIFGEKTDIINLVFASCEYYEFKLIN